MTNRLFVFGLGYVGLAIATDVLAEGWEVAGTCRSEDDCHHLCQAGIDTHVFRRDAPLSNASEVLQGANHVLSTIPPDEWGDPVLDTHVAHLTGLSGLVWLGTVSTTGVYGDRGGDWVDEGSELFPTGERGRRRVQAEGSWLAMAAVGLPSHIFRAAGIYGPGRSPLDQLRAGTAHLIDKPGQVFSRIHVDDLVAVLRASMARPRPGGVYNVCDDEPAPPAEVIKFAAGLLGVEPPSVESFDGAKLSDLARSFYADNKRVRNDRIKSELGATLRYPDYRTGLNAILAKETGG